MTENPLHSRVLLHESTLLGRLAVDAEAYFQFDDLIGRALGCLEQRWISLAAPCAQEAILQDRMGGNAVTPDTFE